MKDTFFIPTRNFEDFSIPEIVEISRPLVEHIYEKLDPVELETEDESMAYACGLVNGIYTGISTVLANMAKGRQNAIQRDIENGSILN